jgi:hypothetical protein
MKLITSRLTVDSCYKQSRRSRSGVGRRVKTGMILVLQNGDGPLVAEQEMTTSGELHGCSSSLRIEDYALSDVDLDVTARDRNMPKVSCPLDSPFAKGWVTPYESR